MIKLYKLVNYCALIPMNLVLLTACKVQTEVASTPINIAGNANTLNATQAPARLAVPGVEPLKAEEVLAKYQNCPRGYYSGYRPGKTRYTKDTFIWVVTPEFAQQFCMPPEFVSTELKGAEAIAFKIVDNPHYEETCGWSNQVNFCIAGKELSFEIYLKNNLMPTKDRDYRYFQGAKLPSTMLLSRTEHEFQKSLYIARTKPRIGAIGIYDKPLFGLGGFKERIFVWPTVGLFPQIYFEDVFEGMDYFKLNGSTGQFKAMLSQGASYEQMAIVVDKPTGVSSAFKNRSTQEFAHVIQFPKAFAAQVVQADTTRGDDYATFLRRALQAPSKE